MGDDYALSCIPARGSVFEATTPNGDHIARFERYVEIELWQIKLDWIVVAESAEYRPAVLGI